MTVKELKKFLLKAPDDAQVLVLKDGWDCEYAKVSSASVDVLEGVEDDMGRLNVEEDNNPQKVLVVYC
jgi:hypothetical protein